MTNTANTTTTPIFKDIVDALLSEAGSDVERAFFNSDTPKINQWTKEDDEEDTSVKTAEEQSITYAYVDSYGGEGQGDEYWSVYEFTLDEEKVYVKFNGYYQSYNGSEYDAYFFVEPKEKVVTEYVKVK